MVKEWRINEKPTPDASITSAAITAINESEGQISDGWSDVPLKELAKLPAERFVKTKQRWCVPRGNPESAGRNKKIEKLSSTISFKIIQEAIEKNNSPYFDVSDIIRWSEALHKTRGDIQREILSAMVCMGFLERVRVKFKDSKGKEKMKYVFIRTKNNEKCPNLISGKCDFEWKKGAVTDYFPREYEEE